nr:hypothetical protein [Aequorivita sp. S2608]
MSLPYKFAQFTKLGSVPEGYLEVKPIYPFVPTEAEIYTNVIPSESEVIEF